MVKHKINRHSRRRNVKPDRVSEPDDSFMPCKLPGHSVKHGAQNERQHDQRKQNMRRQQEKIRVTNETFARKAICRIRNVIGDVANQKKAAERERNPHHQPVRFDFSLFDKNQTEN